MKDNMKKEETNNESIEKQPLLSKKAQKVCLIGLAFVIVGVSIYYIINRNSKIDDAITPPSVPNQAEKR